MTSASDNVPMVAIITRTKDRGFMLERAIQSVDAQTYHDYVHVILNDGGDKQGVETVVNKYKSQRRIVIHNKKPAGIVPALNQAIQAVDSKYVVILDDDDTWSPERLEKTIPYLESTGEKAVVVKMDTVIEEIRGNKIHTISQTLHPESGEGEISLFKQCHKNYLSNGVITYSRAVYDELGGYDESLEAGEDWDFGIRLLMKYDVAFLRDGQSLSFYHQRPNQKGFAGNSVHSGVRTQEKTIAILRNRYLREDLQTGRFGVGYIMNRLEQDAIMATRLEAHMNYCTTKIEESMANIVAERTSLSYIAKRLLKRIKR